MNNIFCTAIDVIIEQNIRLRQVSESAVLLSFDAHAIRSLSPLQKNTTMQGLKNKIVQAQFTFITDTILSYETLLIAFDNTQIDVYHLISCIKKLPEEGTETLQAKIHIIDVCYQINTPERPNDIAVVAETTGLTTNEIIELHQKFEYRVFAVGFMPNFAYLGDLDKTLHVPRLAKPRAKVPKGAVAIADNQTAVYPNTSPGGWHIIAYTHFDFRDIKNTLEVGDKVSFQAINEEAFTNAIGTHSSE